MRSLFRNNPVDRFTLAEGQILTPSARGFLSERRIAVVTAGEAAKAKAGAGSDSVSGRIRDLPVPVKPKYVSALDGGCFEAKPEFMTHLKGDLLVAKDHDRIVFRGRLDSFQSAVLMVQAGALEKGLDGMVRELDEILDWVRQIMKADVLDSPLEKASALGLTSDQLREHSHNPKKAYGVKHITPSADMGTSLLGLNFLRSLVREAETAGVRAFHREFEVLRPDILTALNRMSSALYIMMVRERAGLYGPSSKVKPGLAAKG